MRLLSFLSSFGLAFGPLVTAQLAHWPVRTPMLPTASARTPPPPPGERYVGMAPGEGCFQLPVGPPDGWGYYVYRGFQTGHHLGEDWNGVGGGATDLGDPVFAAADGVVTSAYDHGGGWGHVVRVVHPYTDGGPIETVETLYAHLDEMDVEAGDLVLRGDTVGTIGDAHGRYVPHLHFELRTTVGMRLGGGYGRVGRGWTDPRDFIEDRRCW